MSTEVTTDEFGRPHPPLAVDQATVLFAFLDYQRLFESEMREPFADSREVGLEGGVVHGYCSMGGSGFGTGGDEFVQSAKWRTSRAPPASNASFRSMVTR